MYPENDHISNLFRENEHLLDEQPSRNAWAKLEDKLDRQKNHSTRKIYRYISTAAAVVAVVAMLSAIALFREGDELMAEKQAKNEALALNEQKQEFSINNNSSDWRKEYAPETVEKDTDLEIAEEAEVVAETADVIRKPLALNEAVSRERISNITDKKLLEKKQINVDKQANKKMKSAVNQPSNPSNKPVITSNSKPEITEEEIEEEILVKEVTASGYRLSKDKIITNLSDEIKMENNIPTAKSRRSKESYKYNSNKVDSEGLAEAKQKVDKAEKPTINTFTWLKGTWSDNTPMGLSYEKWAQTDKKTLAANGFLIQNGDTLYIEQMEIKQIRNKIYYITNFGEGKSPMTFELISYINGISTFENSKPGFPSQIILQQKGNSYIITFENSDDTKQTQQFQYRNNVSKKRASRKMSRAY